MYPIQKKASNPTGWARRVKAIQQSSMAHVCRSTRVRLWQVRANAIAADYYTFVVLDYCRTAKKQPTLATWRHREPRDGRVSCRMGLVFRKSARFSDVRNRTRNRSSCCCCCCSVVVGSFWLCNFPYDDSGTSALRIRWPWSVETRDAFSRWSVFVFEVECHIEAFFKKRHHCVQSIIVYCWMKIFLIQCYYKISICYVTFV